MIIYLRVEAKLAKIYDRLPLIGSVLRASKFSVLKLTEIVILWVITPSLLASACFWHFWASIFNFWNYSVWLRITDEGSVPEMRIWSILLIKSDLKWCIHPSRRSKREVPREVRNSKVRRQDKFRRDWSREHMQVPKWDRTRCPEE